MNKIDLHIVWNSNSILLFQNTHRLRVLITEMWTFLLLAAYASAMECFTDANDLRDSTYLQDSEQFVAMKLVKTGHYVIEPSPVIDLFVIGMGESLVSEGTSELEGPVELYKTTANVAVQYWFYNDSQIEVVTPLDLSQPFEIHIEGLTIKLVQNGLPIAEFDNYFRMSLRMGWRNGTICLDYFEDEPTDEPDAEPDAEPTDEPDAEPTEPPKTSIEKLFNFITFRNDL